MEVELVEYGVRAESRVEIKVDIKVVVKVDIRTEEVQAKLLV